MKLAGMVAVMPRETPARTWAPTDTPAARAEVSDAIQTWRAEEARLTAALTKARNARNEVLRKHYTAGVDPRDLARIARAAGWAKASAVYISGIARGARQGS